MSNNQIKYVLNAQLMDNTVTADNKDDKILSLVSAGTADKQRIISEMMAVNPGLERETLEAVVNLEQRVMQKLLLTGYRVNNGLFQAVAQFTGVIEGMAYDPAKNSVYISFTQGKDLREAIKAVNVNIVGEKGSAMYVAGGTDTATRMDGFVATAGRNYSIKGSNIKVVGTDPSVGITLTDSKGTVTKVTADMIAVNNPKEVIFLIPAGLEDGEYTLTLTTQYSAGAKLLKEPRSIEKIIYLGKAPEGGDTGGGSGPDGDLDENPMG